MAESVVMIKKLLQLKVYFYHSVYSFIIFMFLFIPNIFLFLSFFSWRKSIFGLENCLENFFNMLIHKKLL